MKPGVSTIVRLGEYAYLHSEFTTQLGIWIWDIGDNHVNFVNRQLQDLLSPHHNRLCRDCAANLLQMLFCAQLDFLCNSSFWHNWKPVLLRILILYTATWLLSSRVMNHLADERSPGAHLNLPNLDCAACYNSFSQVNLLLTEC